jgi:uncharacterized FlaG/YvyC family protein
MGVSEAKKNQNNSYEHLLGISAVGGDKRNDAEQNIRTLFSYENWSPKNTTLLERTQELQKAYDVIDKTLKSVRTVLNFTIADGTNLTNTSLAAFKSSIDGYQTQYGSISG